MYWDVTRMQNRIQTSRKIKNYCQFENVKYFTNCEGIVIAMMKIHKLSYYEAPIIETVA